MPMPLSLVDAHAYADSIRTNSHIASAGGFYRGALPVIAFLVDISVLGSSTIFSAETFMPFLRSVTEDGLPSTVNRNEGGTLYSRFSPLGSVRTT